MNVETGEIKEFESFDKLQMAMHNGSWIRVDQRPDLKCKKCNGRGHLGRNTLTNLYIPCGCVKKKTDFLQALPERPEALSKEDMKAITGNDQWGNDHAPKTISS